MPKPENSQKMMVQYSKPMPKPENSQKMMVQYSPSQNLSPVRKRWFNTQTDPKPVSSQKKMLQY